MFGFNNVYYNSLMLILHKRYGARQHSRVCKQTTAARGGVLKFTLALIIHTHAAAGVSRRRRRRRCPSRLVRSRRQHVRSMNFVRSPRSGTLVQSRFQAAPDDGSCVFEIMTVTVATISVKILRIMSPPNTLTTRICLFVL